MIINQSFRTLKGTTAHLDKCCANREQRKLAYYAEVPPTFATGKSLRMCKLVIFNALFALYLHFGMANLVQTEWNTKLVWVFPRCRLNCATAKRKCNFLNIKAASKRVYKSYNFYTKWAEAGSWNKTRGTKLSISERRESSLAIPSADNLSKNLQKIGFFTPKWYKNSSETKIGIRAVLLFYSDSLLPFSVRRYFCLWCFGLSG